MSSSFLPVSMEVIGHEVEEVKMPVGFTNRLFLLFFSFNARQKIPPLHMKPFRTAVTPVDG